MQTPFVAWSKEVKERLDEILKWDVFQIAKGYRNKREKKEFGKFIQEDELTMEEMFPSSNVNQYKQLCSNLSNNSFKDYMLLLNMDIINVYEFYALKIGEGNIMEYNEEKEKRKQKYK